VLSLRSRSLDFFRIFPLPPRVSSPWADLLIDFYFLQPPPELLSPGHVCCLTVLLRFLCVSPPAGSQSHLPCRPVGGLSARRRRPIFTHLRCRHPVLFFFLSLVVPVLMRFTLAGVPAFSYVRLLTYLCRLPSFFYPPCGSARPRRFLFCWRWIVASFYGALPFVRR